MKKVFLLQLDGVSGPVLDSALKENLMPFTQSLIGKGWVKRDFFCGLPSTTPASQFRLFYGLRDIVLGFRFFDKQKKKIIASEDPLSVSLLDQQAMKLTDKPLLSGGATICSIFTGNAKESISTSSLRNKRAVFPFLISYLVSPFRVILLCLKIVVFLLIEHNEHSTNPHSHHEGRVARVVHIMKRMGEELLVGEFALFYSLQMIKKGASVIYTDFAGYDEIAHSYGPNTKFARFYLSMLDEYAKRIYQGVVKSKFSYELVIFSDHGQVESIPYNELSGVTIHQAVSALYPKKDLTQDMCILGSGGWGLVYDLNSDTRLKIKELEARFPDFFKRVSTLKGIECAVGYDGNSPIILKDGKEYVLNKDNLGKLFPVFSKEDIDNIVFQFEQALTSRYTADAYLIGEIRKDNCVIFEKQYGAHGSFGGNQTKSFVLSKHIVLPDRIRDFVDIHDAVWNYVHQ